VRLRGRCEFFSHALAVVATDNAGNTSKDTVEVAVVMFC